MSLVNEQSYTTIQSLDAVLAPGVESTFDYFFKRKLVHGLGVGILKDGQMYVRAMGDGVRADSTFEIASTTKPYTAELVSILARKGLLSWEESFATYLPQTLRQRAAIVEKAKKIRLIDIATHCSGLPLLPANITYPDRENPYGSYKTSDLVRYLEEGFLATPIGSGYNYSNLGYMILGYILEHVSGMSYKDLLQKEILTPLGMRHTYLALADEELGPVIQGHSETGRPTARWRQYIFAPAGGLCSTVGDQLLWIQYLLGDPKRDLFQVFPLADGQKTGVGWRFDTEHQVYERDGMTGGFLSYISINKDKGWGVVILSDRNMQKAVRAMAKNCERALLGMPLASVDGNYINRKAYVMDFLRNNKAIYGLARKAKGVLKRSR